MRKTRKMKHKKACDDENVMKLVCNQFVLELWFVCDTVEKLCVSIDVGSFEALL